jgi:CBS domain-containing protein
MGLEGQLAHEEKKNLLAFRRTRVQMQEESPMSLAQLTQVPLRTIQPLATVAEAARLMCEQSIGALVITDASGETPLGIITDRDLVWMIAEGLDAREATVNQFVHGPLQMVQVSESLSDATKKMRDSGVRRLPIVDQESRLLGIVSLDDILVLLGRELADVAAAIALEFEHERRIGAARKSPKGRQEGERKGARQ